MKLSKDYVLRQLAGMWLVVPAGEAAAKFRGVLKINETGAALWKGLEQGLDRDALARKLTEQYCINESQAYEDVDAFLQKLIDVGCTEE